MATFAMSSTSTGEGLIFRARGRALWANEDALGPADTRSPRRRGPHAGGGRWSVQPVSVYDCLPGGDGTVTSAAGTEMFHMLAKPDRAAVIVSYAFRNT